MGNESSIVQRVRGGGGSGGGVGSGDRYRVSADDGFSTETSTVSLSELHRACFKGKLAKCKEIVESDATTLLGIDSAGNSPLHMAAAFGHDDVCSFLLGHGADVDAQSTDGGTALHLAVIKGHASTVKLLVGAGADLSIKSKISKSAYDYAKAHRHRDIVRFLENWPPPPPPKGRDDETEGKSAEAKT